MDQVVRYKKAHTVPFLPKNIIGNTILILDNTAYKMLVDFFGTEEFLKWERKELGIETYISTDSTPKLYGETTPYNLAKNAVRIAQYITENSTEEAKFFTKILIESGPKYSGFAGIPSKLGQNPGATNEVGIIYDDFGNPKWAFATMTYGGAYRYQGGSKENENCVRDITRAVYNFGNSYNLPP